MDIAGLFQARGTHLTWRRLPDERVLGRPSGQLIPADEAYIVVRLAEMFLGTTRVLWRKFSPLLHAFTAHGAVEEHSVAGPGQLLELGETDLDRVIVLNQRLAGPIPFRGDDVSIVVGLYSVPREDAAAALVATIGSLVGLTGFAGAPVAELVDVVKSGVDGILRLGTTRLRLGVRESFTAASPLRSGYYTGIGAPSEDVRPDELWVREGRLVRGRDPMAAVPYDLHDYFVVQVERLHRRPDWPGLPGLGEVERDLKAVMGDPALDLAGTRRRLNELWPRFTETLLSSPYLTRYDAGQIANDVQSDLRARLLAMEGPQPFGLEPWADAGVERGEPEDLDFAEIPVYGDGAARTGEAALGTARL